MNKRNNSKEEGLVSFAVNEKERSKDYNEKTSIDDKDQTLNNVSPNRFQLPKSWKKPPYQNLEYLLLHIRAEIQNIVGSLTLHPLHRKYKI